VVHAGSVKLYCPSFLDEKGPENDVTARAAVQRLVLHYAKRHMSAAAVERLGELVESMPRPGPT
jgi:hypothetical protein